MGHDSQYTLSKLLKYIEYNACFNIRGFGGIGASLTSFFISIFSFLKIFSIFSFLKIFSIFKIFKNFRRHEILRYVDNTLRSSNLPEVTPRQPIKRPPPVHEGTPPLKLRRNIEPDVISEHSKWPVHRDIFLAATFAQSYGSLSETARRLNIPVSTLNYRLSRSPELRQRFTEVENALLDKAETQLHLKIEQGDIKAIMFFLERKGRHRGYGKEVHVTSHNTTLTAAITANMSIEEAARLYQDSLRETLTLEDQVNSL